MTEIWCPIRDDAYALKRDSKTVAKIARASDGWHWSVFDGMWTVDAGVAVNCEAAMAAAEAHTAAMWANVAITRHPDGEPRHE